MAEVLDQCAKAEADFSADPVHDLRTALRRCRSMADGLIVFDRNPAWKKMKRAGRQLFRSLGDLRDTHVIADWIEKLAPESDPVKQELLKRLAERELEQKKVAAAALQEFNRKQWSAWAAELPERAARIPVDSPVFAHLALERWQEARNLHSLALRNRSAGAFHQLRIGIKRFRYTIENFVPRLHELWGADLKKLQAELGDVHDMDVVWQTATASKIFPDAATRAEWRSNIKKERQRHLDSYREKMVGRESLWGKWRAELPQPDEIRAVALKRLQIWASFLDPSVAHSRHVARLALQLYDGLPFDGVQRGRSETYRYVLQAAAYMHDVGRSRSGKGHHKISARLIRKLGPPMGWTAEELRIAALVARYHRGALPRETQTAFAGLSTSKQRLVQFLAGVLRLACACDWQHDRQIKRIQVDTSNPVFAIHAEGYTESTSLAEHLAGARHLLEVAYNRPVLILPMEVSGQTNAA